ncbi:neutral/alkaline non-lysosomal ceramidase N-terminal domain-containing protein [Parendozoicomonas haliclonae]|uniref:neutral/alkaline non-lysosomal ceramidase N-terminal domain-containing protein n=1 Tax=Parendozoicomonas haliclonae TaxID=1960125 RepID=UPI0013FE0AEA|nr:neutral/alkaline non-lysosomal ceramidase N-terminal domain-containing protein [Parendozoicomonas haliclonae]
MFPIILLCSGHCLGDKSAQWLVGVGKSDITGPPVGIPFMGYGQASQRGTGIHDRLWARAFIIVDPESRQRVVMVSASMAVIFGDVTRAIIQKLQERYGDLYGEANLVLMADHTHSGNGGQGGHLLFSLSTHGYSSLAYNAMRDGIVEAIVQAHESLAPGRVLMNIGQLNNASANRSLKAFLRNPEAADRPSIDPEMTVLRFEQNGKAIGMMGWFATHGVSFPITNTLISGDNKAYAAQLMEKAMGEGAVAAFPQTNAGDMTPNLFLDGTGPEMTPELNARMIGWRQFAKGYQLFQQASEEVTGELSYVHHYVDLSKVAVESAPADSLQRHTCPAVAGYGFAAGTVDGRPKPWRWFFNDNMKQDYWPFNWGSIWLTGLTEEMKDCQMPKVSLLGLGGEHDFHYINRVVSTFMGGAVPKEIATYSWAPQVLPVSILKIGQLGLLAVPAEFTITAGDRLKKTVRALTGNTFGHLMVAGYSNDYSLYVTTPEEYQEQLYEGGATLFGPNTLPAYQKIFTSLATELIGQPDGLLESAQPDNLDQFYQQLEPDCVPCSGTLEQHGEVTADVHSMWLAGQTVTACFTASHPNLTVRQLKTLLTIEHWQQDRGWVTVATDDSWDTRFHWQANWVSGSTDGEACIDWDIPRGVAEGSYRIGHQGIWRSASGEHVPYQGYSNPFIVSRERR